MIGESGYVEAGEGAPAGGRDLDSTDELLAAHAAVNRDAFVALYRRHVRSVYAYMVVRAGREYAEDLTSDVFMRALQGIDGFDKNRSFKPWLFGIARHIASEHFRRQRPEAPLGRQAESRADERFGPAAVTERQMLLSQLLSALTDDQREIVALRFQSGLSYREIGGVIGKREGAVRVQMHRILELLKSEMGERE